MRAPGRWLVFALLSVLALQPACGGKSKPLQSERVEPPSSAASTWQGFAFSTVDLLFGQSSVYFYDFKSAQLRERVRGQSGDPFIVSHAGELVLFNRRPDMHNVVALGGLTASGQAAYQRSFPSELGDPGAAIALANGHLLLAFFNKGELAEFDPTTGSVIRTFASPLEDKPLRAVDFLAVNTSTGRRIYVLHQGLGADYQLNGSQAILCLNETDDSLSWGSQRWSVAASYPRFLHKESVTPAVVGLCYPGQTSCRAALEEFDPKNGEIASLQADLSSLGIASNGYVGDGLTEKSFLASVVVAASKDHEAKQLVRVDYTNSNSPVMKTLYKYRENSRGSYLVLSDLSTQTLYWGDVDADEAGLLFMQQGEAGVAKRVSLPAIPYQAVFVK